MMGSLQRNRRDDSDKTKEVEQQKIKKEKRRESQMSVEREIKNLPAN